jgi:eukaryotic-like serine/threonine-protein kinase
MGIALFISLLSVLYYFCVQHGSTTLRHYFFLWDFARQFMRLDGQRFGKYLLVRLLKRGGMGEVYLARDTKINRPVAIKVIRTDTVSYADEQEAREAARLFLRETQVVANLRHEHILPLYDADEEYVSGVTLMYMVMPLCEEGSLTDWLLKYTRGNTLSPRFVQRILKQATNALQYAHDRNIVHQDVKASNFLVRDLAQHPDQLYLQLADFGVARLMTTTSHSQIIRGTPMHMAPEQWEGRAVPATDQYALAVMTYELLTGQPPFESGNHQYMWFQHSNVVPIPPSRLNSALPVELDNVLYRSLAKTPQERYGSVSAFALAFRQALHDAETQTTVLPANTNYLPQAVIEPEMPEIYDDEQAAPPQRKKTSFLKLSVVLGIILLLLVSSISVAALTFGYPFGNTQLGGIPATSTTSATPTTPGTHITNTVSGTPNLTASAGAGATVAAQASATAQTRTAIAAATAQANATAAAVAEQNTAATAAANTQATATVGAYNGLKTVGTLSFTDPLKDNSLGLQWDDNYINGRGGCQFTGGAYLSSALQATLSSPCYASATKYSNFFYEVQLQIMHGDQGGIIFRGNGVNGTYYYYHIDANGTYALDVYSNGVFDHTVISGSNARIDKIPGHTNLLAVQADGSTIKLYVNASYVNSINDLTFSEGEIGVMAASAANPTIVAFSNAQLFKHP